MLIKACCQNLVFIGHISMVMEMVVRRDIHEALNRYAISKLLEYAPEAMHGSIWDINAVDVLGSNLADLSSVTQIHDVHWAFGPGIDG